jgi:hypothetical protein
VLQADEPTSLAETFLGLTIIYASDREMSPTAPRTTTSQIPGSISRHSIRLAAGLASLVPHHVFFDAS